MASTTHTIYVGPIDGGNQSPLLGEGPLTSSGDTILPGHIISIDPNDGVISRATTPLGGQAGFAFVAVEKGAHVGANINTAYDVPGEMVSYARIRSGESVYVRGTQGTLVSKGSPLISVGQGFDGKIQSIFDAVNDKVMFYGEGAPGSTVALDNDLVLVTAP